MNRRDASAERIWFWFANGNNACGAVATDSNGVIREACPIFGRYRGRRFNQVLLDLRERGLHPRWARLA
jgi:hypothetical protein